MDDFSNKTVKKVEGTLDQDNASSPDDSLDMSSDSELPAIGKDIPAKEEMEGSQDGVQLPTSPSSAQPPQPNPLQQMAERGPNYGPTDEETQPIPAKAKKQIVDHFNGLVDQAHGVIASTMPDGLKKQLIDVSSAEKDLTVKNISKTLTQKVEDLPGYNKAFKKQLGDLKKSVKEAAQNGKISVGDLHEIVSNFQKTTPDDADKPHMGEIKGSISSYLLGQADQQTGGLISQSYQHAMQTIQSQGQQGQPTQNPMMGGAPTQGMQPPMGQPQQSPQMPPQGPLPLNK